MKERDHEEAVPETQILYIERNKQHYCKFAFYLFVVCNLIYYFRGWWELEEFSRRTD